VSIAPWSFSRIKAFEQCPKKFYHLKIAKNYREPETEAMHYGTVVHEAAEKYIRDGEPLPKQFEYMEPTLKVLLSMKGEKLCEYEMGLTENLEPCAFDAEDVWFRGIADLIIINRENKVAKVLDYKTGKSAKYADKGQLELMALATFKHFPEIEVVRAGLLFVVANKFITDEYYKNEEQKLWRKWLFDYGRMEKAYKNDVWNAHPSGLCRRHCVVTECPHNGAN
jgi:RecB family exonuclease